MRWGGALARGLLFVLGMSLDKNLSILSLFVPSDPSCTPLLCLSQTSEGPHPAQLLLPLGCKLPTCPRAPTPQPTSHQPAKANAISTLQAGGWAGTNS